MLEFLDSLDIEHPYFYPAPCTRCLECGHPISPAFQKGNTYYWFCTFLCREWVNVGLGSRNQITREIRWIERYKNSKRWGTPPHVSEIPPPTAIFEIDSDLGGWIDDIWEIQGEPLTILTDLRPRPECWTSTSLLSAMVKFRRMDSDVEITLNHQPLTYHEIMHVYAEASQLSSDI